MKRILIIEDDREIAELERDYLEAAGFEVDVETDGIAGRDRALAGGYALVVVDLMLPSVDGFAICRTLREHSETPIMVVSARTEDIDKVRALGLGADDYVAKPFSPAELVARVKAHIGRYVRLSGGEGSTIAAGPLTLDPVAKEVRRGETPVQLTATEFNLLELLARNPNRVFSRQEIFDRLWGVDTFGDLSTVTVHIRRLREKIEEDPSQPTIVETVWGMGYRLRR
ncbi:MAG: response regulator transcription factor [Spirochaetaceae bacterium]